MVDFEVFSNALEDAFGNKAKKNHAEAKPYNVVMMFKIMIIKHYYNLGNHQVQASLCNAKNLAMRSKGNYNDWRNVMRYQLMIVDDLGTEPREVMEFRNIYTPLIDLITTRYEEQLYTIFTTNLTPAQLEEKYGKRIVDRLNEMVEKVVFENESYRR